MSNIAESRSKSVAPVVVRWVIVVLFFGLWQLGSMQGWLSPFYFSSPVDIAADFIDLFASGYIWHHLYVTAVETVLGYVTGIVFGTLVAVGLHRSEFWMKVLDPILMVIYGIPRVALAPLFILWFGLGITPKVVFAFFLVFFLVFYNVFEGLNSIDQRMVNSLRVMGANKWQVFTKVKVPYVIPWFYSALKSSLGMALLGAILGEYIGGHEGVGWLITYASNLFQTTRVFSAILVLIVLVVIMNRLLKLLEKRILKWKPQSYSQ